MLKRFALIMVLVSAFILSVVAPVSASPAAQENVPQTISVSGTGTAYAAPDVAFLYFGVETANTDISAAVNDVNARVEAVRAALTEFDIPAEDIRTENFNIYQDFYSPDPAATGAPTFRVSYMFRVKVTNLDVIADILSAVLNAGATSVSSITFDIEDRTAVENEALALAIESARAKADEMARLLGVTVGNVVAVSDFIEGGMPFYGGGGGGGLGSGGAAENMAADVPPISSGSLGVSVTVYVTYELVRGE